MTSKNWTVRSILLMSASIGIFSVASIASALEYNGTEISFEQVYASPDDNDLKLNYARQQAAAGDLLSAAGALEGMLYTQPNWDSARLFYAVVLYQLDDRASAQRELDLLDNRPLSPEHRKLADSYRKDFKGASSNDQIVSGVAQLGVRTDDNAGNALFDTNIISPDISDSSAFASGALRVSVPIIENGGLNLNAGVDGQTRRHKTFSNSDYDVVGLNLGVSGINGGLFWASDIETDNIFLSGEKYLTQIGVKFKVGSQVSDKTRLYLTAGVYQQDFEELSFSFDEKFRSGSKYIVSANLFTRVDENTNYGASVGYENKDAKTNSLSYTGFSINGNAFKGLDSGLYFKANAKYRNLNYAEPDLTGVTPVNRSDSQLTGRIGTGAPVSKIGSWLGIDASPALARTYLETAINYTNISSNISIYEFENLGAELKFIWDF